MNFLLSPVASRFRPGIVLLTLGAAAWLAMATSVQAQVFPRTDGVYRVQKRTRLINFANVTIYDYLVFQDDQVHVIEGDFVPPEKYGLVQPVADQPGAFFSIDAPLAEQPAAIRKWLRDPDGNPPLHSKYSVDGKTIRFTLEVPGGIYRRGYTLGFVGQKSDKGLRVEKSWLNGTRAETLDYEFIRYGEKAPPPKPPRYEQQAKDRIQELLDNVAGAALVSAMNMKRRAYAVAAGGSDAGIPSIRNDVQNEINAKLALEQFVSKEGEKLVPLLEEWKHDQNNRALQRFAEQTLRKLSK